MCCFLVHTVCSRSLDSFHIKGYYVNWVKTSWTYSITKYVFNCSCSILSQNTTVCSRSLDSFYTIYIWAENEERLNGLRFAFVLPNDSKKHNYYCLDTKYLQYITWYLYKMVTQK